MKIIKKEILFRPAFDKRSDDPQKNYGVHGVDMVWLLHTDRGVCQFVVFTGWMLPHIKNSKPMAADIGYHSPVQQYEGQQSMSCDLLGTCYYDGSGLQAEEFFQVLIAEGSDAVWQKMETWFQPIYDKNENSQLS